MSTQSPMTQSDVFSYTKNQPQNVEAWRFGEACRSAAGEPRCGDPIDMGLILLRELEAKGYGIVKLPPAPKRDL